jgi:putative transposase
MEAVREMGPRFGIAPTCSALGLARATYYRRIRPSKPRAPRPLPNQAPSPAERQVVLATRHEDRCVDLAPAEIYAQLLDAGQQFQEL